MSPRRRFVWSYLLVLLALTALALPASSTAAPPPPPDQHSLAAPLVPAEATPTSVPVVPANDYFAAAVELTLPASVSGDNQWATTESGEPITYCGSSSYGINRTVWYRFTPAASGTLSVITDGSSFTPYLVLFQGNSLSSLTRVGCDISSNSGTRLNIAVASGQTYYLQLGGYSSNRGPFTFSIGLETPPPNDDFAAAAELTLPTTVSGDNQWATTESGEPTTFCGSSSSSISRTVWYKFTPTTSGTLSAITDGASFSPYLALHQGTTLSSLSLVGCDTSSSGSRLNLPVTVGQTYYLQVGWYYGAYGAFSLQMSVETPPPNDNFAAVVELTLPATVSGDNQWATTESGEPGSYCGSSSYSISRTVWYKFTAATSGTFSVITDGSSFTPYLGLYRGTSLSSLTRIGCDYSSGSGTRLNIAVTGGQTYYLQVGGYYNGRGAFTLQASVETAPANDNFAAAASLTLPTTVSGDNQWATVESNEPTSYCGSSSYSVSRTVWYKFTPTTSGTLSAITDGSSFTPHLTLYQGTTLSSLTRVGCDYSSGSGTRLNVSVRAGQTYYLQVGWYYGAYGAFSLQMSVEIPPLNDTFAAATSLTLPATVSGDNQWATTENNETLWCGSSSYSVSRTVWYKFTAATSGTLSVITSGSGYSPQLALFQGASVSTLTRIGCDYSSGSGTRLNVSVTSGQTYYLQVGSYYGERGAFTLQVSVETAPANDNFAAATSLTLPATVSGDNRWATTESNEPTTSCGSSSYSTSRTVWYRFTSPSSGTLSVVTDGSSFTPHLSLYQGTTLSSLTRVGCDYSGTGSRLNVPVTAGQTYYLQLGWTYGAYGAFTLHVAVIPIATVGPSATPVGMRTPTPSRTPSPTAPGATRTPSPTAPGATRTPTVTPSPTWTPTATLNLPTVTATASPTVTPSRTWTATPTPRPPTPAATPDGSVTPPAPGATWTFMLYLAGDNNLYSFLNRAARALEAMPANPNVNLVVLFDGDRYNDAERFVVQPGGHYVEGVNHWRLGEVNTGDWQTLSDFIVWTHENYPSQYTYLAIADHGRGTQGVAWDESSIDPATHAPDYLTTSELYTALAIATNNGQWKLDIVHYDTCLMAMLENAYQIKDFASYLVASQNLAWSIFAFSAYAPGKADLDVTPPYEFAALASSVTATTAPADLAVRITDLYFDHPALRRHPRTISALDLSQTSGVVDAVNGFADALHNSLVASLSPLNNARHITQKYDSRDYYRITDYDEYLDLSHFADRMREVSRDGAIQASARRVIEAVARLVIAERHESGIWGQEQEVYWDLDNARGVSIYFPPRSGSADYIRYIGHTSFRSFTLDSRWDDFLTEYFSLQALPPDPSTDQQPPDVLNPTYSLFLPHIQQSR